MNRFKRKILVIVEGAKTDVVIMKNIFGYYRIDAKYEIVSYCTDIYTLYHEMFEGVSEPEAFDILQVLKAKESNVAKKKIFEEKYTDILLIFDLDPHDPKFDAEHIQFMQKYFCESSDMGKLYLNYPMVEAFYHLRAIPDPNFYERKVFLKELEEKTYKTRVQKETKGNDYRKFLTSKKECNSIIFQNAYKAMFIMNGEILLNSNDIINIDLEAVLNKQLMYLKNSRFVYVLCTCVLYIVEYNPKLLYGEDSLSC